MSTRRIRTFCFIFVCFFSFLSSFSQDLRFSSGIFSGDCGDFVHAKNVWAIQVNPAQLAYCNETEIGVAYNTNFSLTDMVCTRVNASTQMKQLALGTSMVVFGNSHYRESYYQLCISRKLNNHNALSVKFNLSNLYQDEYGNNLNVYSEVAYFGEKNHISYGVHCINPFRLVASNDVLSIYKIQGGYAITNAVSVTACLVKIGDYEPYLTIGGTYCFKEKYMCTIAYRNTNNPLNFSVQIPIRCCILEYDTNMNFYLGLSHTICFRLKI